MSPLLSIVIATKNREIYCIRCIQTILQNKNKDFELVVQDNSNSKEINDYISKNIKDNRLVYHYTPDKISSIDNFNETIKLAKGEYVCMIGDDDLILPYIFPIVRFASQNGIDSICPTTFIDYYWPHSISRDSKGYINIPKFSNTILQDTLTGKIDKLIKNGCVNYMKYHFPKLYHGIIKRELLMKIYNNLGYYFGGLSPDIYSAISLSTIVKKQITINFPITIAGVCPSSTSAAAVAGNHTGVLKSAPHFLYREWYIWHDIVPKYYSVQTIWADSCIAAIQDNSINIDIRQLNIYKLLANSIADNPKFKRLFIKESRNSYLMKSKSLNIFKLYVLIYYRKLMKISNKCINRIFRPCIKIDDVKDIEDAERIIIEHINKKGFISKLMDNLQHYNFNNK